MKGVLLLSGLLAALPAMALTTTPVRSSSDLSSLRAEAAEQNRLVLLFITRSGDCPDCETVREKFFGDRAFTRWVEQHTEVGELDVWYNSTVFPAGRQTIHQTGPEIAAVLRSVFVQELPELKLIRSDGRVLASVDITDKPAEVVARFQKLFQNEFVTLPGPVATGPRTRQPALQLKMISGPPERRLASINDEAFFPGESREIIVAGKTVTLHCLAIDEQTALVKLEGEALARKLTVGGVAIEPSVLEQPATAIPSPADVAHTLLKDPEFRRWLDAMKLAAFVVFCVVSVIYVPFTFSCFRLCRRAGTRSHLLIWLPGFKRIPLFQVTGVWLSWFFLGWFIPFVGFIAWTFCCARLCEIFQHSKWWTLLMIWPVIGWPVFLYFDHTSRAEDNEPAIQALREGYATF